MVRIVRMVRSLADRTFQLWDEPRPMVSALLAVGLTPPHAVLPERADHLATGVLDLRGIQQLLHQPWLFTWDIFDSGEED